MKVNHRNSGRPAPYSNKPAAYITSAEADKLRAANAAAVKRAATLTIEIEALKKRNAELIAENKRLIAEAELMSGVKR